MTPSTNYITDRAVVDEKSGCWNWVKSKNSSGYGNAYNGNTVVSAHRLSYMLFNGDISEGMQIDHLCRNRMCVNPEHLEAVTQHVNIRRQLGLPDDTSMCAHGHSLEHKFLNSAGRPVCGLCKRNSQAAYRERKRAAASS